MDVSTIVALVSFECANSVHIYFRSGSHAFQSLENSSKANCTAHPAAGLAEPPLTRAPHEVTTPENYTLAKLNTICRDSSSIHTCTSTPMVTQSIEGLAEDRRQHPNSEHFL
jgi:hypothetical protein